MTTAAVCPRQTAAVFVLRAEPRVQKTTLSHRFFRFAWTFILEYVIILQNPENRGDPLPNGCGNEPAELAQEAMFMERFCRNCGAPRLPNAKFCAKCGKPLPEDAAPRPAAQTPPPQTPRKTGKKAWKTVLIAAAACLVLGAASFCAVRLFLSQRGGEKDAAMEADPDRTVRPAEDGSVPDAPSAPPTAADEPDRPAQPAEDQPALQDGILDLRLDQLSWTDVTGEYGLAFSVPEGFEQTASGLEGSGNVYLYASDTLGMQFRVWEGTGEYTDKFLFVARSGVADRSTLQETANSRTYRFSEQDKLGFAYETGNRQFVYYAVFEYPDGPAEEQSAYEDLIGAILARLYCRNEVDLTEEEYILPQSAERRLTEEDLAGLSHQQLSLARNEIYARHGRMFKNKDIAAWFSAKDWYVPSVDAASFDAAQEQYLSEVERYNAGFLLNYEKQTFGKTYY